MTEGLDRARTAPAQHGAWERLGTDHTHTLGILLYEVAHELEGAVARRQVHWQPAVRVGLGQELAVPAPCRTRWGGEGRQV